MPTNNSVNYEHASSFEPGIIDSTHACFVKVKPEHKKETWQEGLKKVKMINIEEGDCDGCDKWECKQQ